MNLSPSEQIELNKNIKLTQERIAQIEIDYQKSLAEAQTMRERGVKNPEIKSFLNDIKREYNNNLSYSTGKLAGYQQALVELEKNANITYGEIEQSASRYAAYQQELATGEAERLRKEKSYRLEQERLTKDTKITEDTQRAKAVQDMLNAQAREGDMQRQNVVLDMQGAIERESKKEQLSNLQTKAVDIKSLNLAPFQSSPEYYLKGWNPTDYGNINKISQLQSDNTYVSRTTKEIPRIVKDYHGNVFAEYKSGRILIEQGQSFLPQDIVKEDVKKTKGLLPSQKEFLGYDTYGKPVYKTTIEQPSSVMDVWKPEYEKEKKYLFPVSQFLSNIFGTKESTVSPIMKVGTISPTESPFKTFGELQTTQDIDKLVKEQSIIGKYNKQYTETYEMINKKVSEGKINVEEANKLLESKSQDININLNKELEKIKTPQRYITEPTNINIKELATTGVEMASLLNPATASLMGAYKFSKLPTTDEYTYYNPKTGKTETVYPTEKASFMEKAEATSFLVLGGLSAGAKTRKLAKEIVEEELSLASKQPIGFKEIQAIGREGEATKVVMKGGSTFRGLKTNIEVTGKVYPLPGDKTGKAFIMPSGTGEARISGETSFTLFGKGQPTYIAGIQEFEVGAKGVTFNIGKGELSGITDLGLGISKVSSIKGRAFGTIGTGTSIPTEGTSIIYTTEEVSPYLNFPSPNIKYLSERQIKKQSKELAEGFVKGYQTGGEITKELTTAKSMQLKKDLFFTVTEKGDIGLTKVIYPKAETEINIFRGGGTKTPLSKTFQVTEEKGILGISKIIEKPVSKITKSLSEGIIKQIPKETISPFFAGSVLIEKEGKLGEGNRFGNLIGTGRIGSLGVTGKFGDLGVTETGFEGLEVSELAKTKTRTEQETKTREKESLVSATSLLTGLTIKTSEEFKQPSALAQPSRQKEATKQKQESLLVISPQPIKLTPRITYPEEFGWGFGVGLPRREKGKKREQNAYLPQVYRDATKRMKAHWETISKTPMTKQSALSESAREVDNAISSRGRVIKTKGKPIDTGEDYFGVNRQKFRTYSQKGGVKRQLPNSFIEKRAYRLDSPNETKTIQREKRKSIDIKRMFGI